MSRYTLFALVLVAVASVHCTNGLGSRNLILDGRDVSPGEQCERKGYSGACKATDPAERCSQLKCTHATRGDIPILEPFGVGPALQGTSCGDNKICIAGKCSDDPNPPKNAEKITETEYGCLDEEEEEEEFNEAAEP